MRSIAGSSAGIALFGWALWGCTVSVDRGSAPVYGGAQPAMAPAPQGQPPVEGTAEGFRPVQGTTFAFAVPVSWQQVPMPAPVVVAVRDPNQLGGMYTNVNLVTESYGGDARSYASANMASMQTVATILGERGASVGNLPAVDVESAWTQPGVPYRTLQRFTAINGVGYVLTCTGAHQSFEQVRGLCDAILGTFMVAQ